MASETETAERLASIETKVDFLVERAKEDRNESKKDRSEIRNRVRNLEAWRYGVGGSFVLALVSLISSDGIPKP